ncbi:septal ring lytic transglycosylase RlpA family protein, partial [Salmonella enterica subsp. enterica serovar Derby]
SDGMKITLTMVDQKSQKRRVAVPFSTKKVEDSSLPKGEIKVITKGVNGINEETWTVVFKDGKKVSEKKVSSKVVNAPVTQVVKVGTKTASSSSPSTRSSSASHRSTASQSSDPVTSGTTCLASTYG